MLKLVDTTTTQQVTVKETVFNVTAFDWRQYYNCISIISKLSPSGKDAAEKLQGFSWISDAEFQNIVTLLHSVVKSIEGFDDVESCLRTMQMPDIMELISKILEISTLTGAEQKN
jgi:hypothetical protein